MSRIPNRLLSRVWVPKGPQPKKGPTRRGLLRGVLAGGFVTLSLPWLELFVPRKAFADEASLYPVRFGVWYWGNGNRPDDWLPTGEGVGDEWALSEELAPLVNVKQHISVISGMGVKVPNYIPHWSGAGGLLTGRDATGDDTDWTVGGPTIDQMVADAIGGDTIFKSLEIGLETDEVFSFNGPNARNPGETDPYTLYQRIFGDTFREPGEEGIVDPRLGYRRSALDAVMGDIAVLEASLGTADKARLEAHLDGVRDLETRLARLAEDPADLESCHAPEAPATEFPEVDGAYPISARAQAMHELIAMAMACDQTRVFHFQISKPVSNLMFPGAVDGHHNLTHDEPSPQPGVHAITVQIITELAWFLERLAAIPEGDGVLLDNAAILCTSEHGEAQTHAITDIPMVIAGGGGGTLQQGVHYRSYTEENAGKVTLSLLRAVGVNAADWGEDDTYTTEGLSEIEA